jgi:hypothetical protein
MQLGTDTCNPKVNVWSPEELRDLGRSGINVWTVNDETVMRQLIGRTFMASLHFLAIRTYIDKEQ